MKRLIAVCLIFFIACKNTYDLNRVIGGSVWSVYQMEHGNKDLIVESQGGDSLFVFSRPLYIDLKGKKLILEIEIGEPIVADFTGSFQGKRKGMKVYNSTDARFNGDYQVWIDTVSMNSYRDEYRILLESDSIFIVGTKTIIKKI